jgi:hypothetical protein
MFGGTGTGAWCVPVVGASMQYGWSTDTVRGRTDRGNGQTADSCRVGRHRAATTADAGRLRLDGDTADH